MTYRESKVLLLVGSMCTLLWLLFLTFAGLGRPATATATSFVYKNIFILAGQSNMAGRGGVVNDKWDGIVPSQCQPNPSIIRLDAGLSWVSATEPLHADIDLNKTCGVGPGMAFANAVKSKDSSVGVIGLVPCAVGGTNISQWMKGSHLYEQMVRRAQTALQEGGTIRAIVWYQGESDTVSRADAEAYKGRMEKLIADWRADLRSPNLHVIQVVLASGMGPFIGTVREAQLGIHLPNVMCVDAMGLPIEPDGLHLTTEAQVRLGQMLAAAYLNTMSTSLSTSLSTSNARRICYPFFC
ncbi:probable carbohydrate esterase At4g34215 [Telopea speciosissima]|uniref:probable carbohydrate esterase At4g34215 n=1 Tax=Telopea speciosissima TaxID=54955 RepID=UPI001CC53AE9|nr:probable carbohydrate esterase At4g34215 [Telopea speciosissima]